MNFLIIQRVPTTEMVSKFDCTKEDGQILIQMTTSIIWQQMLGGCVGKKSDGGSSKHQKKSSNGITMSITWIRQKDIIYLQQNSILELYFLMPKTSQHVVVALSHGRANVRGQVTQIHHPRAFSNLYSNKTSQTFQRFLISNVNNMNNYVVLPYHVPSTLMCLFFTNPIKQLNLPLSWMQQTSAQAKKMSQ